jgi:hypothetical protein
MARAPLASPAQSDFLTDDSRRVQRQNNRAPARKAKAATKTKAKKKT